MTEAFEDLKHGVVLAELGGHGDGPFCGKHGAGAALVLMGTYIVDGGDSVPYPEGFVFKPDPSVYAPYLEQHVAAAGAAGAKVGVSVITTVLADTVSFLRCAASAGAEYVSLCAYSTMEMFTTHGLGVELCRAKNAGLLKHWCTSILRDVRAPLIMKIGLEADTLQAVETMVECGVRLIHVAVPEAPSREGLAIVERLCAVCPFLIVGGGIRDAEGAERVLHAGAGAVSVAAAAVKDATVCGSIQRQLSRKERSEK